jgi:tRNA 2-thiouridine synthesizing protein C
MANKILLIVKSSPYGWGNVAEGFRIATAMIAMDFLPQILFIDDGVYCLVGNQKPEVAGLPSFGERLKTIADLVGLHACSESLSQRKLKQSDLDESYNTKFLSLDEAAKLIEQNEAVITF